jgi:hypothetical protein
VSKPVGVSKPAGVTEWVGETGVSKPVGVGKPVGVSIGTLQIFTRGVDLGHQNALEILQAFTT